MEPFDYWRDMETRTCSELHRSFSVVEVVGIAPDTGLPSPVEPGTVLSVTMNPTSLTACEIERVLKSGTGGSFQALRYRRQRHVILDAGKAVLVFFRVRDGKYSIVTEGAVESPSQKRLVKSLLKKQAH